MDKKDGFTPIAVAITDFNKDGNPDLLVSQFIDYDLSKPNQFERPEKHAPLIFLRGDDEGNFRDVTKEMGLKGRWNTFTSAFIDLNNDNWADLVISPDAAEMHTFENIEGDLLKERENPSGYGFWMGIATGDITNNGQQDLFLTNIGPNYSSETVRGTLPKGKSVNVNHSLLRNNGSFDFRDITEEAQVKDHGFGWGCIFEDLNLNGYLDLVFAQNAYFLPQYH